MEYSLILGMINTVKVIFFLIGSVYILLELVEPLEEMIFEIEGESKEAVSDGNDDIKSKVNVIQDIDDSNRTEYRKVTKLR